MVTEKKCKGCGKVLPISRFYKNVRMTDGHLSMCKDCCRPYYKARYLILKQDVDWVEKERSRGREKYKRLGYVKKYKTSHRENSNTRKYLIGHGIPLKKTDEVHHWNYNQDKSVFILTRSQHKIAHQHLLFDVETGLFTYNGNLLKTKNEHRSALFEILNVDTIVGYDL